MIKNLYIQILQIYRMDYRYMRNQNEIMNAEGS